MGENQSLEDLKMLRNYLLGTIAFTTAVSTLLIQVFHLRSEPTLICVGGVGILFLVITFLIGKSENRQKAALLEHQKDAKQIVVNLGKNIEEMKDLIQDSRMSALRIEMNSEINFHPENHDTILKYAYKYFEELKGDWVETEIFATWMENEKTAGRPVNLPSHLFQNFRVIEKEHKK